MFLLMQYSDVVIYPQPPKSATSYVCAWTNKDNLNTDSAVSLIMAELMYGLKMPEYYGYKITKLFPVTFTSGRKCNFVFQIETLTDLIVFLIYFLVKLMILSYWKPIHCISHSYILLCIIKRLSKIRKLKLVKLFPLFFSHFIDGGF